jgi:hypothetical protein
VVIFIADRCTERLPLLGGKFERKKINKIYLSGLFIYSRLRKCSNIQLLSPLPVPGLWIKTYT